MFSSEDVGEDANFVVTSDPGIKLAHYEQKHGGVV